MTSVLYYNELKKKGTNEAIPYVVSCVKEMGLFGKIMQLFGGK